MRANSSTCCRRGCTLPGTACFVFVYDFFCFFPYITAQPAAAADVPFLAPTASTQTHTQKQTLNPEKRKKNLQGGHVRTTSVVGDKKKEKTRGGKGGENLLQEGQVRIVSKETYSVKRDLQCQKRPTVSKETYSVKRDLQCQKRPTVSKET